MLDDDPDRGLQFAFPLGGTHRGIAPDQTIQVFTARDAVLRVVAVAPNQNGQPIALICGKKPQEFALFFKDGTAH